MCKGEFKNDILAVKKFVDAEMLKTQDTTRQFIKRILQPTMKLLEAGLTQKAKDLLSITLRSLDQPAQSPNRF
jgi:hypothetical protein